ncbi:MAG TPA: invasin domain 3-containing protein [Nitrososphaera sp.]|nr:invasin domain 3-containing protein [Nitrososphaera sp.]
MRIYYLRLTTSDFTQSGNTWTSDTIDLYDNSSYRNFSTWKADYGLDLLGNGVWTGIDQHSPTTSDTGEIVSGRYLDTSGRVDVVSYNVEITNTLGTGNVGVALDLYGSPVSTGYFPDEWHKAGPYPTSETIDLIGAHRYMRVVANFSADSGITFDATIYLRIEIGLPIISPLYRGTRNLLNKFPEWMAIRELDNVDHATPELATPVSLGGKVLNALVGEWLDELNSGITYLDFQRYISTVDLNQKAWVYKVARLPQFVYSVTGDGTELTRAYSIEELYEALPEEDVAWWDEDDDIIYTNKLYDEFQINGTTYHQELHHVWNFLDDLGLSVDLGRLPGESNESFQKRVLDVNINKPGVGVENFKKALRRELNLWKVYGSTPDSNYVGATPEILEIEDIEKDPSFVGPDGLPTRKFIELVDRLASQYPTTWGRFRWDRGLWDIGGPKHEGFSTLPYQLDATPLSAVDTQAGVGDGPDLLVFRPGVITGPHDFRVRFKARGRQKTTREEYLPVELEFYIYGQGDRLFYTNPTTTVWLTVEIKTFGSATVYYHSFQVSNVSNVDVDRPDSTSETNYLFFDLDGSGTDDALTFSNKTTGAAYDSTGHIPLEDIETVTLVSGKWSVEGQAYTLAAASDVFSAWFSHDDTEVLVYNTSAGNRPSFSGEQATPSALPQPRVVMRSKESSSASGTWKSEKVPYKVVLNDNNPPTTENPVIVQMPNIVFDPYITGNKEWVVELKNSDQGTLGGQFRNEAGSTVFLNSTYFAVDDNNTWTQGKKELPHATTTSIEVSTVDGALYPPTDNSVWTMFEYTQTVPYNGTVDENGPWRNGEAPSEGNNNYNFMTVNLGRDDFGIPETTNYVVTWMGVEVLDDTQVLAWIDSNTVEPAVADNSSVTYPVNAIKEHFNGSVYSYDPFVLKVRLRPDPSPEWHPQIHSGWFYQDKEEYYFYAKKFQETTSAATPTMLASASYQGAPIIVSTSSDEFGYFAPSGTQVFQSESDLSSTDYIDIQFKVEAASGTEGSIISKRESGALAWDLTLANKVLKFTWSEDGTSDASESHLYSFDYGYPLVGRLRFIANNGSDEYIATFYYSLDNGKTWIETEEFIRGPASFIDDNDSPLKIGEGFNGKIYYVELRDADGLVASWDPGGAIESPWDSWSDAHGNTWAGLNGAVVVPTVYLRQVAFMDSATPGATPSTLSLINVEQVDGTGIAKLYLAYPDVYDVSVVNLSTGQDIDADTFTRTSELTTDEPTNRDHVYSVTYTVRYSFIADHEQIDSDGTLRTKLIFDKAPADIGVDQYYVNYEGSRFDPATPVNLPLNPLYTTVDEGFIFISKHEYPLLGADLYLSPTKIIADGSDYIVVTLRAHDKYGNPKAKQQFALSTTFGTIAPTTVTTDNDGAAIAILTAAASTTDIEGTVTATGPVSIEANFDIDYTKEREKRLIAAPSAEQIPADGVTKNIVLGKIEDEEFAPISGASVTWKKARSLYEVLATVPPSNGTVISNTAGHFTVGPFTAATPGSPGYWFVSMETTVSGDTIGDVVYWHEYGESNYGVENFTGLPHPPVQMATPVWNYQLPVPATPVMGQLPPYSNNNQFPTHYDEATPVAPATPIRDTPELCWLPPKWFAIPRYIQYQLGLLGDVIDRETVNITTAITNALKDTKWL